MAGGKKATKSNKANKATKTKKVRKSKSKKTLSKVTTPVTTPVTTTPVTTTPVTTTPVTTTTVTPVDDLDQSWSHLLTHMGELWKAARQINVKLRQLQKLVKYEIREAQKRSRRRAKDPNRPKRAPSGFAKPAPISNKLCDFLERPYGTEMARTEVTKYLTNYIKEHNLQDPSNKRRILPDDRLRTLLSSENNEVTYFNLQTYMKTHFVKKTLSVSLNA